MSKSVRLYVVTIALVVANGLIAQPQEAEAVLLKYASIAGKLRYHYTMDTESIRSTGSEPEKSISSTTIKMRLAQTQVATDRLQVALSLEDVDCVLPKGRKLLPFVDKTVSWEMRQNGELTWVGARFGFDPESIVHRLKDSPARVGDRWSGTVVATDRAEAPAIVDYVLEGFVELERRRFAKILWTSSTAWISKTTPMKFTLAIKGELLFDYGAGHVRRMVSQVVQKGAMPNGKGMQQRIDQTMELVGEESK